MQVKPLSNRVLVKAVEEAETTKGGIILPANVEKEKPEKGEVIAVGPGKVLDNGNLAPMSLKPGDKVVFKKYSPDEIKVDGQELLILDESDILAVIA